MATATPFEYVNEGKGSSKYKRYVCPICLESVKTPRSLPCLHTFCEDCLHTFIIATSGKGTQDVACPVCRKQIVAPESGLPYDKWAKSFPINYYLSTSFQAKNKSDVNKMEYCQFCERSEKSVPAEHFCKNCAETICDACKQLHQIVPSLKNHTILTLECYKKNPTIPESDEICPLHPNKVVEVYCLDHCKMCCSVCFATKHRHCKDVKAIEECADELPEDVSELITKKLESVLESVQKEIKEKESTGARRKKSKEEAVVKMTKCTDAAKKNLDLLLQTFESVIDRQDSADNSGLQNILKILRGIKTSVVGDIQMLETVKAYGSKTQVFVALEKVKTQMSEQLKQILDVASELLTEGYTVEFQKVEEVRKLKCIGTVSPVLSTSPAITRVTLGIIDSCLNDSDVIGRTHLNLEPQMIKWDKKWSYRLDSSCFGATVFGQKIAVVTSTKKIVIFNKKGEVLFKDIIQYCGEPADINYSEEGNKFFISFRGKKILKGYHIDDKKITELSSEISLQGIAEGYHIFDDQIVHASAKTVHISKMNGEMRKSIHKHHNVNVSFLSGCQKQQVFYYIDGCTVCCKNIYGDTVKEIPLSQHTKKPRGLGIDFQGNVYVCCNESPGKLLQISHNDNSVRVALNVNCYTIAFHPDGMSFVLIDFDGNLRFYTLSD